MGKQKIKSFEDLGKFFGVAPETGGEKQDTKENPDASLPPVGQELELHFSKKGRAGKIACVIKEIEGETGQIKALAKYLKTHLGVGGSVKDSEIIIQGNLREKIARILREAGYKTKMIGG